MVLLRFFFKKKNTSYSVRIHLNHSKDVQSCPILKDRWIKRFDSYAFQFLVSENYFLELLEVSRSGDHAKALWALLSGGGRQLFSSLHSVFWVRLNYFTSSDLSPECVLVSLTEEARSKANTGQHVPATEVTATWAVGPLHTLGSHLGRHPQAAPWDLLVLVDKIPTARMTWFLTYIRTWWNKRLDMCDHTWMTAGSNSWQMSLKEAESLYMDATITTVL